MASSGKKQQQDDDEESTRRNRLSTESKESSYMGFDRGIDSDIEMEMAAVPLRPLTPVNPGCRSTEMTAGDPMSAGRCSSEPHLKRRMILTPKLARWESLDPPEPNEMQNLLPMEATKATPICQSKVSTMTKREENMELVQGSTATTREYKKHQPANHIGERGPTVPLDHPTHRLIVAPLASATSLTSIGSSSSKEKKDHSHSYQSHGKENDSLLTMLSGLYAKLLIVMGICFPLAEVISKKIPVSYYEGFYLYLYIGSIAFLLFVYVFLLRPEPSKPRSCHLVDCFRTLLKSMDSVPARGDSSRSSCSSLDPDNRKKKGDEGLHCGSFYLRLGAVAFGIGSMIYSGLEFGQFFELEIGSQCYNILYGLTPTTRMAFTFVQMYFIFLNSRISINKYKSVARFGLMHMIATNLCVWLHVLVQETKHGILTLANHNSSTAAAAPSYLVHEIRKKEEEDSIFPFDNVTNRNRLERSISEEVSYVSHECRRSNIMGELVQEASHFLFPCTIEYSLICAAILYIMWKNIGKYGADKLLGNSNAKSSTVSSTRHRHYYQVDCAKANKGLFTGILVLVLSIISIILFFVLIGKPEYKYLAVLEARITELVLYLLTAFAVVVALFQVRELKYNPQKDVELDNILLIVAQSGIYLFTMFSIIGGHFTTDDNTLLVLVTSMACLVQVTLQTIFILDASHRHPRNTDHVHRKPGREMVTFLLVCNFALWAINTLQTQRADSNPVQLNFYGFWAWTIITHVTTPLAIYFRFHSTVCLCDIWKRTYKLKAEFV